MLCNDNDFVQYYVESVQLYAQVHVQQRVRVGTFKLFIYIIKVFY